MIQPKNHPKAAGPISQLLPTDETRKAKFALTRADKKSMQTSETQNSTAPPNPPIGCVSKESASASSCLLVPSPERPKNPAPKIEPILEVGDVLSDPAQAERYEWEKVLKPGWHSLVQAGLALGRIRDGRLYRVEFDTFDAYCRGKWQHGRRYIHQLIAAAQLFTRLRANWPSRKPDRETQLRPLIGLPPEQAVAAWERAVEKAGNGKITARMVKSAVEELQPGAKAAPVVQKPGPAKPEQRRLIDDTIGQLLVLLSKKASHGVLVTRVEALHGHIQALFTKPPSKA
jgi:hypothetical protein